jgi:LAO/AO transport system kinase
MLDLGHRQKVTSHQGHWEVQKDRAGNVAYDFWQVPIVQTVAIEARGIAELYEQVQKHRAYITETGSYKEKERLHVQTELIQRLEDELRERFFQKIPEGLFTQMIEQVITRQLDPISAIQTLLTESS